MRNELFRALYSARNISIAHNYTAYLWRLEVHPHTFRGYIQVHSGTFRYIQVHSGSFRYIRDVSLIVPLVGDHGNREEHKYTWVHSVQPPQPYIILKGGRGNREARMGGDL